MSLGLAILLVFCINYTIQYSIQSTVVISSSGNEFVPIDPDQLLTTFTARSALHCHTECNKLVQCRTFDYDQASGRCRLFEADETTGSVVVTVPRPDSHVYFVQISATNYASSHNQPCDRCEHSRYEICQSNSTCQCPPHTYWNGSMCLVQLLENQTCSHESACRSDLNQTCLPCYENIYTQCGNTFGAPVGITLAGHCNGTVGTGSQSLNGPRGIMMIDNKTLYVADTGNGRVQAYAPSSRSASTMISGLSLPVAVFVNSNTSTLYVADHYLHRIFIMPQNRTIPPWGAPTGSCALDRIQNPYDFKVDRRSGDIYISNLYCNYVLQWGANASTGSLANIPAQSLNAPGQIDFIEQESALYVADISNAKVQKFLVGTATPATTVAGGSGAGEQLNQLNHNEGVCVSRKDGAVYVADANNHRIIKWAVNASAGVVVAGQAGQPGQAWFQLAWPVYVALSPNEEFLLVSDFGNNRVQKFRLP